MMGRKAARNMQSSNTNKIGIQCICWFYSQGICYDARSYDRKIKKTGNVRITCHWGAFVQPLLAWKRNKYYRLRVYVLALGIQHVMRRQHVGICGLSGSNLFYIYHIDGKILGNTLQNKICVLIFSASVWNISRLKKNTVRCYPPCTYVFLYSARYSCQILTRLYCFGQIFEKYSNIKCHGNPSNGGRGFPCGKTDRQTWRS
jgi:hypothetical protein